MIGVGVNLAPREAAGLSTPPAGLRELLPGIEATQVLLQLGEPLVRTVLAFERQGFAPFAARFNDRDVLRGREVMLSDGQHGMAHGVDEARRLAGAYCRWHETRHQFRYQRAPARRPAALTRPCCACSS